MASRIVSVRDRNLSLWQSAVDEAVSRMGDHGRAQAMLQAATQQVLAATGKAPPVGAGAAAASAAPGSQTAHTALAKAMFDHVNATQPADAAAGAGTAAAAAPALSLTDFITAFRDYSTADVLGWAQCAINYAKYLASGSGAPMYVTPTSMSFGVLDYRLPENAKVVLIGDWGANMSDNIAMLREAMKQFKPDAIIHLGDIYYSGTQFECTRNVLNALNSLTQTLGIKRPAFFTIPGNHEYYSGGAGFYDMIGKVNDGIAGARQQASYFCLRTQNDTWQFLGMDTGYGDHIPGMAVGPSLQQPEALWHQDKLKTFKGSTILLSHHQLFSANSEISRDSPKPYLNQALLSTFKPYFDRVPAWFWGHEHNLVIFKDGQLGLKKGRLLGCSAYEESLKEDPYKVNYSDIVYADKMPKLEQSTFSTNVQKFYNHAFALLEISPAKMDVSYFQYPSWDQDFKGQQPALTAAFFKETLMPSPPAGM